MISSKQILFLIIFISFFGFQKTYSQIPDSLKLTLNSDDVIHNKNLKYFNFFDESDIFYFPDTLFYTKYTNYMSNTGHIIFKTDVNFMESKINRLEFNVNPVLTEVRLLNQSPLDIFLFKYSYRFLDSEYKTINPLFHKEHLFINK